MIGTVNLTELCRAGLKSIENKMVPNLHPRIGGKVYGIFSRIYKTDLYPMSEIEMDKMTIWRLEHSNNTAEEKNLLRRASIAVYLAEKNAQARELKRAMNGEPPEDVDSEEDEDYWKCEKQLTAEENEYLLRNRHPNIHPRLLGRANSIFARLFRKPDISLTEVKKHEIGLRNLRMSCKTPEEEELVNRVSDVVSEARQYAGQRALARARHPKSQDEEEEEIDAADDCVDAQEDNWTVVKPFEVEPQTQDKEEACFVDNRGQAESGAEVQGEDSFVDNWAEAEPFETHAQVSDTSVDSWAHPEPFQVEDKPQENRVDNWTAHEEELKQQAIIPDLMRKLWDSEIKALCLAEDLRVSKKQEEQMKMGIELLKSSHTGKCHFLETQLDQAIHNLREQTQLSKLLMLDNELTTEALEKSRSKEAELQGTVKVLKGKLEKSRVSLKAQQQIFNESVHILAREMEKSRLTIEKQAKRILELEKKVAEQEIRAAPVENRQTFLESVFWA